MADQLAEQTTEQLAEQLITKLNYLDGTKEVIADAIEQAGASITPEMTFRDYANVISELSTGDVLLFETVDEMQAYENPKDGILALIYKSEVKNINVDSIFNQIIFPQTVTVDTEITTTINLRIRNAVNGQQIGNIIITSTYVNININNVVSVAYISEDGINYTRETEINNPINIGYDIRIDNYYVYSRYATFFLNIIESTFNGVYQYIRNSWENAPNQFNLDSVNQLLTNYMGYGKSGQITGDGSFISNIRVSDYVNKYMPNINDNTVTFNVIQNGTPVKRLTYVQREKISVDDAFNNEDVSDCIVQITSTTNVNKNISETQTLINNYLDCQSKRNYSFYIGDVAYRLYLGYNYNTTQIYNDFSGQYQTEPYQMTSLYAFIVNLEDLTIYKTFQNNDSWVFTNKGFGNLLTYAYSIQSDCLVLLTDMDGWLWSDGAHIGLTTIKPSGVRTTNQYTVNYSTDYTYKSIAYTSYDNTQDCYYLALKSANSGITASSIRRICKLTPSGTLSSIYECSEDMKNISTLWSSYFKNLDSIIYYSTDTKSNVIRNLTTNQEIQLYGNTLDSSSYFGIDAENLYIVCKKSNSDTYYALYKINKTTLAITKIYDINTSYSITNCFYTYNRHLAFFYNNEIISMEGEKLANYVPSMLSSPSISGIDYVDGYGYKASFMDYNLVINSDKFTAMVPTYTYYRYSDIRSFPITGNLCLVATSKADINTNSDDGIYKYRSLIITDVAYEDVDEAIAITERILGNSSPSETARYIQEMQALIDRAVDVSQEIEGVNDAN